MKKIWTEEQVDLESLFAHVLDSGFSSVQLQETGILGHTDDGIGFVITLDAQRKFVRFASSFPLDPMMTRDSKRELAHRLNDDVFLPSFCLDDGGDLHISYVMTYQLGLIAGQFMSILLRFVSLLGYIVEERNEDGEILLGSKHCVREPGPDDEERPPMTAKVLLN